MIILGFDLFLLCILIRMFQNFGMNFPVCHALDSKPCNVTSCSVSHSEKFRFKFLLLSVCLFVQLVPHILPKTGLLPTQGTGSARCRGSSPGKPLPFWGAYGPAKTRIHGGLRLRGCKRGHSSVASAKMHGVGYDVATGEKITGQAPQFSQGSAEVFPPTSKLGFQEDAHFLSFFFCSQLFSRTYNLTYTRTFQMRFGRRATAFARNGNGHKSTLGDAEG